MGDDPEASPQVSLLGSEEQTHCPPGPAPAVMGCDSLSSVAFDQNLSQALPEFSSFYLIGLCIFSNMSLLFLAVHCPTDFCGP